LTILVCEVCVLFVHSAKMDFILAFNL
jgi:hypothetical protein